MWLLVRHFCQHGLQIFDCHSYIEALLATCCYRKTFGLLETSLSLHRSKGKKLKEQIVPVSWSPVVSCPSPMFRQDWNCSCRRSDHITARCAPESRQQKVNLSQKHVTKVITKAIGNRKLHSNTMGGIFVCFDTDNKFGSSSRALSLDVRRTKKATRSKAKTKRDKRNNKNKKLAKRVHLDDSLPNGDSLMMCLVDSSTAVVESSLVGTEFTLRHGNYRKEPRIRRLVSPLEGDLKQILPHPWVLVKVLK